MIEMQFKELPIGAEFWVSRKWQYRKIKPQTGKSITGLVNCVSVKPSAGMFLFCLEGQTVWVEDGINVINSDPTPKPPAWIVEYDERGLSVNLDKKDWLRIMEMLRGQNIIFHKVQ